MAMRRLENRSTSGRARSVGRAGIVLCQHVLVWTALYIAASTIYTLVVGAIAVTDIPSVVLLMVSSIVSVFYVALHTITSNLRTRARNLAQCERADTLRSLAVFTLRILATLWLVSSALSITITTSRHPLCDLTGGNSRLAPLDKGTTCILNRASILSSFVALIASGILFMLLHKISEPFRCHLFGIVEEHRLLPLFLPYHQTAKLAMRSEMSFKCRSSTSVEEEALAPRSSSANLLPPKPLNALGLGIYTSKTSLPPLVTPRRSMSTIRTKDSMPLTPMTPADPLPPMPVYLPYRCCNRCRPGEPPQRPVRPIRTYSFMADPIPMASPTLAESKLAMLRRDDSLSSMYSRSTGGESLPSLSESGRSLSPSSSTSSLGRTPLKVMSTVAEQQDHVVSERLSSWEVDDVAALEARISPLRLSCKTGVMKGHVRDTWVESPVLPVRKQSLRPGKIRKTRESGVEHNMF